VSGAPERETVVVIDDDHAMRLSCRKILAKLGFRVETFENGAQGLEAVVRLKPALVLVDLKMPGMSGMEVIPRVREISPDIVIVVITGYATIDTAVEAMKSGAYDFLPKPFSPEELRLIVARGLERRRLALRSKQAEMERELLKRRFVSFVSHQLRSPLAAIHQYLDVLARLEGSEDTAARRREWYDRCLKRTEELQVLVKDWLTLARLEGSCLAQARARVDLKAIVVGALEANAGAAAEARVTLDARMPEGECAVRGDANCVSVLVDNLVANAIQYNKPGGSVTVTVEAAGAEWEVAVSDTGIGISEEHRDRLFEEFYRVEGTKPGGTGLGLAICRRVAAEMGGSIRVESEPGAGSTFRVTLLAEG
jgi:two-component system sensor histidine kinase/response regulator